MWLRLFSYKYANFQVSNFGSFCKRTLRQPDRRMSRIRFRQWGRLWKVYLPSPPPKENISSNHCFKILCLKLYGRLKIIILMLSNKKITFITYSLAKWQFLKKFDHPICLQYCNKNKLLKTSHALKKYIRTFCYISLNFIIACMIKKKSILTLACNSGWKQCFQKNKLHIYF